MSTAIVGLYLQDPWRFAARWALSLGARIDHESYGGFQPSARAALSYDLTKDSMVHAAVSRAFQMPAASLVWQRGRNIMRPSLAGNYPEAPRGLERTTVTEDVESWMSRNHFALRRVHSLLGIIPVGLFLIEHLLTNSLAFLGPEKFNEQVHWLHELHYLVWLEVLFIFMPLFFHAIYGVAILWTAKNNAHKYPYLDNWRFLLQRYTGVIVLLFVVVHLCHFRFAHWFGGAPYPGTADPFALTQHGFFNIPPDGWWFLIYAIAVLSAVFHFSNGIVTFCITWGITISVASRKRMTAVAGVVFAVLVLWGGLSLYALATVRKTPEPPPTEAKHLVQQETLPALNDS